MEEDNFNPYQTSPTLTVKQAVMYILGYRGEYEFEAEGDWFDFDLYDYLQNLQEMADCACSIASDDLGMLKRDDSASLEAIEHATQKVDTARIKLRNTQKLPEKAEGYRLLINHEISKVRLGKRSPLTVDEDETARTRELRITLASFQDWLEGMELNDETPSVMLPVDENSFDQPLSRKSAESLYATLGLLVSMFAQSKGLKFGTDNNPTVINIAKEIDECAKQLNGGHQLHGQGHQSIRKRIEIALFALNTIC
jgi:hypothetical protein